MDNSRPGELAHLADQWSEISAEEISQLSNSGLRNEGFQEGMEELEQQIERLNLQGEFKKKGGKAF
jgi:hypothetical protein